MPKMQGFCVIIPAKDEELVIAGTIENVIQAGIVPLDIYVIDDGSQDNTGAIALDYGVHVLRNTPNIGKARSIKRAVGHFLLEKQYRWIALMDADTKVDTKYFVAAQKSLENDDVAAICGQAKSLPHNWLTAYRCLAYWISHAIYKGGQSNMGVITVAPGCCVSYRASIFGEIDWSSDTIVEDMDSTIQIHRKRKKLGRIVFQKKAIVYTQDPKTLKDYIKQLFRWHTGAWQVGLKHKMLTGLQKIDWEYKLLMGEGLIFAVMYLLLPLWLVLSPKVILFLLLDMAVTFIMSCFAGIANRRKDVILYSPAFPVLRYIDCAVLAYSFWNTVIRRRKVKGWFKAERYRAQYQAQKGGARWEPEEH